jgi:predicted nucleic acid-binding Zn finger protein
MTPTKTTEKNVSEVEPRTVRALKEYLTVLPEHGRVKGADGLVLVVSATQEEYVVDVETGACECPDATYNLKGDELCKHARRARFALGIDAVPAEALEAAEVEPNFGAFVDTDDVRVATADGGIVETEEDVEILTDEDDEDECEVCAALSDDLPCFEHFMQERGHSVGGDA